MPGVPPQGGFGYPPNPYPNAPAPGPQVIIINNQQGGHHPQPQIQQAPFPQQEVAPGKSHCSNGVALLLCFLLGVFGAHRFYVGRIGSGLAMLLISIIPAFADSDLGFVITVIWAIIDFLLIVSSNFKDSHGRKLSWH
jgi:TM2 domain-containing membrane protein YozV